MIPLVLASASPRRAALLQQIGLPFEQHPPVVEEKPEPGLTPIELARHLALQKAREVASQCQEAMVLAADTLVVLGHQVLGKPRSEEEAFVMLHSLQDNTHQVITGVALNSPKRGQELVTHELTEVRMRAVDADEIWFYIQTGEPMDKAGAYAIQGLGAVFVERIVGCYYNVVGLPLAKVWCLLHPFYPGTTRLPFRCQGTGQGF